MFPSADFLLSRVLSSCSLRHTQVLLMLAETGSMQRAAEAMGLPRSSLEQALSQLEDVLETELFKLDGRELQPTPACAALLPHARQVLAAVAGGVDALAAQQKRDRIQVRVLASTRAARRLLTRALPAFEARYARVHVQWREACGEDPAPAMERGEVDLVAGRRPAAIPEGWAYHELLTDRFAAVCAPDHPLAAKTRASWDDLSRQTWLLPPAGSAARQQFDALMAQAPNPPDSFCVVPSIDDLTDWLLRDHEMIAFVPTASLFHLLVGGELVQLHPEDSPREPLGLLQPRSASDAALRLAGFLQHFAANPSGTGATGQHA